MPDNLSAMSPNPRTALELHEQLAFAGLARVLVRADGTFSSEEAAALEQVARDILGPAATPASPYREASTPEGDPDAIWALVDRSASELPDEEAVRIAARRVTRREAREAIFGALLEIASSDVISSEEWPVLDWLAGEWAVESRGSPDDEPHR
jgi:hypothetical protein